MKKFCTILNVNAIYVYILPDLEAKLQEKKHKTKMVK